MVRGTAEVDTKADTAANKALVLEFTKQVLQEGNHGQLDQFISDDIVQHATPIGSGRAGLSEWLSSEISGSYEMLFNLIGQGDFVMTYGKCHALGEDFAVFDLYRVADGLIVEQWQNAEQISPRENWGNSGKF